MKWLEDLLDDKSMVIIAVFLLGVGILFSGELSTEKAGLLNSIFTGLFGVAIGRASKV